MRLFGYLALILLALLAVLGGFMLIGEVKADERDEADRARKAGL